MDDPWDNAIREAYTYAPDEPILAALEFRHPAWAAPVRVVRDTMDLDAKLEADAVEDPGAVVTFGRCAFEAIPPESSDNLPQVRLRIDNVSMQIATHLVAAMGVRQPVSITYREFLPSDCGTSGPHYVLSGLTLRRATCTAKVVTGTAVFGDFTNRAYPSLYYTADDYEGLVR
jgi:hypothetical protein